MAQKNMFSLRLRRFQYGVVLFCLTTPLWSAEPQEFDCIIEPYVVVNVGSPVKGILASITVDKSDTVKKGQVLAKLESAVEKANVNLARARTELDVEIKSSKVTLAMAERQQTRINDLFAKSAVSSQQKDEADTETKLAALQLGQVRKKKEVAKLDLRRAQAALERRTIRSPISGVVVQRFSSPGEFVKEEPILTIATIDPLRVEAIVPATIFGKVSPGMRAEVIPERPKDGIYEGKVSVVDRVIDASSGTFGVRVQLPNPDHQLPGGLRCKVRFLPGEK